MKATLVFLLMIAVPLLLVLQANIALADSTQGELDERLDISILSKLRFELRKKPKGEQCLLYWKYLDSELNKTAKPNERDNLAMSRLLSEADTTLLARIRDRLKNRRAGSLSLVDYLDDCIRTIDNQRAAATGEPPLDQVRPEPLNAEPAYTPSPIPASPIVGGQQNQGPAYSTLVKRNLELSAENERLRRAAQEATAAAPVDGLPGSDDERPRDDSESSALRQQIEELRQRSDELTSKLARAEAENTELKREQQQQLAQTEAGRALDLGKVKEQERQLLLQVSQAEAKSAHADEAVRRLESENSELRAQVKVLGESLARAGPESEQRIRLELGAECDKIRRDLKAELGELASKFAESSSEVENLGKENERLRLTCKSLFNQVGSKGRVEPSGLDGGEQVIAELKAENELLRGLSNEKSQQVESLANEKRALMKQLEANTAIVRLNEDLREQLRAELQRLDARQAETNKAKKELEFSGNSLMRELDELRSRCKQLTEERDEALRKVKELSDRGQDSSFFKFPKQSFEVKVE